RRPVQAGAVNPQGGTGREAPRVRQKPPRPGLHVPFDGRAQGGPAPGPEGRADQEGGAGEKHPEYASSLNNLATLYYSMGDRKQALPLHKEALAIRKEVLGEWHSDYATSLNNLALLYQDMEDYKKALPLFQKALVIYKETQGEKHPAYV